MAGPSVPKVFVDPPRGRRRRVRPMSDKRRAELAARRECREVVLERDGGCVAARHGVAGACRGALEVHEIVTRARGGSITDPSNCVALCGEHHEWVTGHPAEAHTVGLVRWSWEASS